MGETVRPLGSRALVRVEEEASVTASGLVIPDTAKDKPQAARSPPWETTRT